MKTISTYFLLMICFLFASVSGTTLTTIKAVVFDFNGVIVKTDRQMVIDSIAQALELPQQEIERAYVEMKKQKVKGEKNQIRFWTQFAQSKGKKLPEQWIAQYRQLKLGATKEIPGMLDIVRNLQKREIETGLLTNASKESIVLKKELGLFELFKPALFADQIGIKKPDPKIFQMLLEQLHMAPQEVLFIDNNKDAVETAKKMGMDAIIFKNAPQITKELKNRGIAVD